MTLRPREVKEGRQKKPVHLEISGDYSNGMKRSVVVLSSTSKDRIFSLLMSLFQCHNMIGPVLNRHVYNMQLYLAEATRYLPTVRFYFASIQLNSM